jgi:hypothetical protein
MLGGATIGDSGGLSGRVKNETMNRICAMKIRMNPTRIIVRIEPMKYISRRFRKALPGS